MRYFLFLICFVFLLAGTTGCSLTSGTAKTSAPKTATSRPYKITNSHMKAKWFYPRQHYEYVEEGYASYYGGRDVFHGRRMASGEVFDKNQLVMAHRELPIPSVVRLTNIDSKTEGFGRSVKASVKDRGPFAHIGKRIADVSEKTARVLGFYREGTAKIRIEVLVDESVKMAQNSKTPIDPNFRLVRTPEGSKFAGLMLTQARGDKVPPKPLRVASLSESNMKYLMTKLPSMGKTTEDSSPPLSPAVHTRQKATRPEKLSPPLKPQIPSDFLHKAFNTRDAGIFVQTGPYQEKKRATTLKKALQRTLATETVKVVKGSGKGLSKQYHLKVGPFESTKEAQYLLARLERQGYEKAQVIYE